MPDVTIEATQAQEVAEGAALWSEDAVFQYHSRSRDVPPGKGAGESLRVPAETFAALARHANWRQKLSNFADSPLLLDGLTWRSVEHAFQAAKFREVAPAYYRSFAIESGSALAAALGPAVKSAGGRKGHPLSEAQRAEWELRKHDVMRRALLAKFSQNEEHRAILLATGTAKLTHQPARSPVARVEVELMEVRATLRAQAGPAAAGIDPR